MTGLRGGWRNNLVTIFKLVVTQTVFLLLGQDLSLVSI